MNRILIALVALITMGTTANAAIFASGGLFGGFNQGAAACLLFNSGTAPVTVSASAIVQEGGGSVTLSINTCGSTLAAGAICAIAGTTLNNAAYACKFVLSPDTLDAQGTFEMLTGDGKTVLATYPLQRD